MNILIPAAGLGSRFTIAGYTIPKPFINVKGKTMVEWVVDNISTPEDKIYVIHLTDHLPYLTSTGLLHRGNIAIIPQMGRLPGAVATCMLAKGFINNDEPLVIINSDQWVVYDKEKYRQAVATNDGTIMTFWNDHPKWSYAETDETGRVLKTAEKVVLPGNQATVGCYAWRHGKDFVESAEKMMGKGIQLNGEFYVCPTYNEMIERDIRVFEVNKQYGLGTPEDLEENYNRVGVWE